jgi:hypothetical protein
MRILCLARLLDDFRVIEEIERYKWIESERLGRDIGEKQASLEWIRSYGCHWLKIHKRDKYQAMLEELCRQEQEVGQKPRNIETSDVLGPRRR